MLCGRVGNTIADEDRGFGSRSLVFWYAFGGFDGQIVDVRLCGCPLKILDLAGEVEGSTSDHTQKR